MLSIGFLNFEHDQELPFNQRGVVFNEGGYRYLGVLQPQGQASFTTTIFRQAVKCVNHPVDFWFA